MYICIYMNIYIYIVKLTNIITSASRTRLLGHTNHSSKRLTIMSFSSTSNTSMAFQVFEVYNANQSCNFARPQIRAQGNPDPEKQDGRSRSRPHPESP